MDLSIELVEAKLVSELKIKLNLLGNNNTANNNESREFIVSSAAFCGIFKIVN